MVAGSLFELCVCAGCSPVRLWTLCGRARCCRAPRRRGERAVGFGCVTEASADARQAASQSASLAGEEQTGGMHSNPNVPAQPELLCPLSKGCGSGSGGHAQGLQGVWSVHGADGAACWVRAQRMLRDAMLPRKLERGGTPSPRCGGGASCPARRECSRVSLAAVGRPEGSDARGIPPQAENSCSHGSARSRSKRRASAVASGSERRFEINTRA